MRTLPTGEEYSVVGERLSVGGGTAVISEVTDTEITLDMNHQLAWGGGLHSSATFSAPLSQLRVLSSAF